MYLLCVSEQGSGAPGSQLTKEADEGAGALGTDHDPGSYLLEDFVAHCLVKYERG